MADTQLTDPNQTDDKLGEAGLKALQAERDARKAAEKALTDAQTVWETEKADYVAQLASKDQERETAVKEAVEKAAKAEATALRVTIAARKGIDPELADRLVGATREELEADADKLLQHFMPGRVPPRDPSQGKHREGGSGGTVESGKDLYHELHSKKKEKN